MLKRRKLIAGIVMAVTLSIILALRIHLIWFAYFGGADYWSDAVLDMLNTLEGWRVASKTEAGLKSVFDEISRSNKLMFDLNVDDLNSLPSSYRQILNTNCFFLFHESKEAHISRKPYRVSRYKLGENGNASLRFDQSGNPIDFTVNVF